MPAAAVIPALRVYMNVVVVKTLIAYNNGSFGEFRVRMYEEPFDVLTESLFICCRDWKRFTDSGSASFSID